MLGRFGFRDFLFVLVDFFVEECDYFYWRGYKYLIELLVSVFLRINRKKIFLFVNGREKSERGKEKGFFIKINGFCILSLGCI